MASHATGDGNIPARDANKKGLKRIMTVGGVYGTRNYTVKDLRDQKGKKILTETVPFSVEEAGTHEGEGVLGIEGNTGEEEVCDVEELFKVIELSLTPKEEIVGCVTSFLIISKPTVEFDEFPAASVAVAVLVIAVVPQP